MSLFNDISKTVEEMDNPSHEVKLKKAFQVILRKNISQESKYF